MNFPCACIDTSDGLVAAIETILCLNKNIEVTLDLDSIYYADGIEEISKTLSLPKETFILGSAGEYELLAFVSQEVAEKLVKEEVFRVIGSFCSSHHAELINKKNEKFIRHLPLPDPREEGLDIYRIKLIELSKKLFWG